MEFIMRANFIIGKRQIILASLVVVLGAAVYLNWQFAGKDKINLTDTEQTNGTIDVLAGDDTGDTAKLDEQGTALIDNETDTANADEVVNEVTDLTDKKDTEKEDKNAKKSSKEDKNADKTDKTDKATEKTNSTPDTEKHLGDSLLVGSTAISADDYFAKAKLTKVKTRDESIETIATILNDEKLKEEDKQKATDTAISLTNTMEVESRIENLIKSKGFEECIVYLNNDSASVVVKTEGLNADLATQIKNIVLAEGQVLAENISIMELF